MKSVEVKTSPKIPVSPPTSSKPLSAIATSTINPAAAALAALAMIANSVENNTETTLDLKNTIIPPLSTRKSPVNEPSLPATGTSSVVEAATPTASRSRTVSPDNSGEELTEPQPTYRSRRPTRRAPLRSKKPSDDWRQLVKPLVRSPNSKKLTIDLKFDTKLEGTESTVETINDDTEGMDVDADMEDINDAEKNAVLEVEDDEVNEAASQQDDDAQPIDDAGEGDDEPADPEGEGEGDEDQEQDQTNKVENEQDDENENNEENEEEPLPDGDLEDPEIELQPAHSRAEALDILASIELKFAMLREQVYIEKMEILGCEWSKHVSCISSLMLRLNPLPAVHPNHKSSLTIHIFSSYHTHSESLPKWVQ